jgi:hypothetical protein
VSLLLNDPGVRPLGRESTVRPLGRWRQAWQSVRRQRPCHVLFVQPGQAWSYAPDPPHPAVRHDDAAAWCAAHPQRDAELVVSAHATHELVVQDATLPLHDAAAVAAWAAHQFVHYHGSVAQHWPVAPWQAGGRSGATAIHGLDLAALEHAAQGHGVRLRAVRSWWPVALAAATRRLPALADAATLQLLVVEGLLLTHVSCSAGAVLDVQQRWLQQPTLEALRELLHELAAVPALADASLLLGYGVADAGPAGLDALPVRVLGTLHEACPAHGWVAS